MANASSTQPAAVLKRRRSFTIEVPGLGPVTYSKGETVPEHHYEHVDGQDRRWFDAVEGEEADAPDEADQVDQVDQDDE